MRREKAKREDARTVSDERGRGVGEMLTFHWAGKLPYRVGIPKMKASNSVSLLTSEKTG